MTLNDKPHDNEKKMGGRCFVNINTPVIGLSNTKQKTKRGWTKFFLCFISSNLTQPAAILSYQPTGQQASKPPVCHLLSTRLSCALKNPRWVRRWLFRGEIKTTGNNTTLKGPTAVYSRFGFCKCE